MAHLGDPTSPYYGGQPITVPTYTAINAVGTTMLNSNIGTYTTTTYNPYSHNGRPGDVVINSDDMTAKVYSMSEGWIMYDIDEIATKIINGKKHIDLKLSKQISVADLIKERQNRKLLVESMDHQPLVLSFIGYNSTGTITIDPTWITTNPYVIGGAGTATPAINTPWTPVIDTPWTVNPTITIPGDIWYTAGDIVCTTSGTLTTATVGTSAYERFYNARA